MISWGRLKYEVRWWLWFLSGPRFYRVFDPRIDPETEGILFEGHRESEPDFHGWYPHQRRAR